MSSPRKIPSASYLCAMSSSPKSTPTLPPLPSPITADRCRPLVSPGVYISKDKSRARRHSWFVDGKLIEMPCDTSCVTDSTEKILEPTRSATGPTTIHYYSQSETKISSRRGRSTLMTRLSSEMQRKHTR